MGVVYKARDTRLDRFVALKILPPEKLANPVRKQRFVQEAKSASALNHPNIVTIHDIGAADGIDYIAMEYVAGKTLDELIPRKGMRLSEALKIAIQVADALTAAHHTGIVHRDLKPGNIIVGDDGRVRVLDFGLAKLAEPDPESDETRTAMADNRPRTEEGTILGTVSYMSPEQAEGRGVDARSDIFSFGSVLYEMVTGQRAFRGESTMSTLAGILKEDPKPVREVSEDVPGEVERLIRRCLRKDVDRRYQHMADLKVALEELKDESDSGTLEMSVDRRPAGAKRTRATTWAAAAVLVLAVIGYTAYRWTAGAGAPAPSEPVSIQRLTNSGNASVAAISPDGRYVVHVVDENGLRSLSMLQVATGSNVEIQPPADVGYGRLSLSPDSTYLYFSRRDSVQQSALYRMPVLGGQPTKILDNAAQPEVSPDGARVAYVWGEPGDAFRLMVANVDGSQERELARVPAPDYYSSLSWAPDGQTIAVTHQQFADTYHGNIVTIPADGGPPTAVGSRTWYAVRALAWAPDGNALFLVAADQQEFPDSYQIWRVPYPDGAAEKLTSDLNNRVGISVASTDGALVTVQTETNSTLWVIRNGESGTGTEITSGLSRQDQGPVWMPDGGIVFSSSPHELSRTDADGAGLASFLSSNASIANLRVCGDDSLILVTDQRGTPHMSIADIDGSNLRQLLNTPSGEGGGVCTPDGESVFFVRFDDPGIWKVGLDGSEPVRVTAGVIAGSGDISPDGQRIAGTFREVGGNRLQRLAVLSFDSPDGEPEQVYDLPGGAATGVQFTPDGEGVTYQAISQGVGNLWVQQLSGGQPEQLTHFASGVMQGYDWSPDGDLVLARGSSASDVVLIRGW